MIVERTVFEELFKVEIAKIYNNKKFGSEINF